MSRRAPSFTGIVRLTSLAALLLCAACAEEVAPSLPPAPRPVTAIPIASGPPVSTLGLTGSIESWKEQDVAFEVAGRVEFIREMGANLDGRWVQDGVVRNNGDLLAQLDTREYQIAVDGAAAALQVAEQDVHLAKVERDEVQPAKVRAAEAERDRAVAEYDRIKAARDRNAVSELELIRARAARDSAIAMLEQTEADRNARAAQVLAAEAARDQAAEQLRSREYDLERTLLHAPFRGEVSEVYIEAGGFAQAAQPVAHLVMMDPIKVDVAVSSETASRLRLDDPVLVLPPRSDVPQIGHVYEKSTVADRDTRAFRVSVILRNERVSELASDDPELLELPRTPRGGYLFPFDPGDPDGPVGVEGNRALRSDAEGYFVWAGPELPSHTRLDPERPVMRLRKVRVVPGERRRDFQGLYLLRELVDVGELTPHTAIGWDVPEDFEEGGEILIARETWRMNPGELARVILSGEAPADGFYAPMNAIEPDGQGGGHVFAAIEGAARRIPVKLGETVGDRVRIEAADPSATPTLSADTKLIADHLHFLVDGEPVRVVKLLEADQ